MGERKIKLDNLIGQKFNRLEVKSRGPNDKHKHVRWWCLCDCGMGVLVWGFGLTHNLTKSCGCFRQEVLSEKTGNKNPGWKGGVTSKHIRIRTSKEYAEWRTQIFERDNYTCQKCKTRSGYINAHHIESFNNTPELRTSISNGITFCKVCHENFHHQFGYMCTRQQLNAFMENSDDKTASK